MNARVGKPLDFNELTAAIRKYLYQSRGGGTVPLRPGSAQLKIKE